MNGVWLQWKGDKFNWNRKHYVYWSPIEHHSRPSRFADAPEGKRNLYFYDNHWDEMVPNGKEVNKWSERSALGSEEPSHSDTSQNLVQRTCYLRCKYEHIIAGTIVSIDLASIIYELWRAKWRVMMTTPRHYFPVSFFAYSSSLHLPPATSKMDFQYQDPAWCQPSRIHRCAIPYITSPHLTAHLTLHTNEDHDFNLILLFWEIISCIYWLVFSFCWWAPAPVLAFCSRIASARLLIYVGCMSRCQFVHEAHGRIIDSKQ